jgi:hypothetical protein
VGEGIGGELRSAELMVVVSLQIRSENVCKGWECCSKKVGRARLLTIEVEERCLSEVVKSSVPGDVKS